MPNVYFISDPHFGHNTLNVNLRGMTSEECADIIIRNWNKKVTSPKDKVYLVGDVTMEKHNFIEKYISQLNGTIVVIGGNHDNRKCCEMLQQIGVVVMGCLEYKGFIVTHIPVIKSCSREYRGNIHGHIHTYELPSHKYISVVPELNGYTPLSLDEIIEKQRNKKKIKSYIKLYIKMYVQKIKMRTNG